MTKTVYKDERRMFYGKRVYMDTREYMLDTVLEKYNNGMVIFPKKMAHIRSRKEKKIRETLQALIKGIPFPVVYASELQTGELLIIDNSDRLQYLLEYLNNECFVRYEEINLSRYSSDMYDTSILCEQPRIMRDLLYSTIVFHIIEYANPKYVHMQIGSFVSEWSPSREQGVRNILYSNYNTTRMEFLLKRINNRGYYNLKLQYELTYLVMFYFVVSGVVDRNDFEYDDADKYQLIEITLKKLIYIDNAMMDRLSQWIMDCYVKDNKNYLRHSNIQSVNELCFASWDGGSFHNIFENREIRRVVNACDMGYEGIHTTMNYLKGNMNG